MAARILADGRLGSGAVIAYRVAVTLAGIAMAIWRGLSIAAAAAQWIWNLAMMANPIGLIIIGVTALIVGIALLVKYWDYVALAAARAWRWMRLAVGADTTEIDATIARLEAKIEAAEAAKAGPQPSGGFGAAAPLGGMGVMPPATAATPAERAAASGIAPTPAAAAPPVAGGAAPGQKRVLELNVNLSGRQIHRAVVDEDNAAVERSIGSGGAR